jgi:heme/copper-type cytochrome/quinol oxidase subunit 2
MKIYQTIAFFLLFTFVIAIPPYALKYFGQADLITPGFWTMFFFVLFLTLLVIVFILFTQRKNSEMYGQAFIGATGFKLLACLIFVLVFIRENHPEKIVFVADFMYIYFLNMSFEVYLLLCNLRNQNLR